MNFANIIGNQGSDDGKGKFQALENRLNCYGKKKYPIYKIKTFISVNGGTYSNNGKTCYKAVSLAKTWEASREYCQDEFKLLLSLT